MMELAKTKLTKNKYFSVDGVFLILAMMLAFFHLYTA